MSDTWQSADVVTYGKGVSHTLPPIFSPPMTITGVDLVVGLSALALTARLGWIPSFSFPDLATGTAVMKNPHAEPRASWLRRSRCLYSSIVLRRYLPFQSSVNHSNNPNVSRLSSSRCGCASVILGVHGEVYANARASYFSMWMQILSPTLSSS
jgi:hypothetical protein